MELRSPQFEVTASGPDDQTGRLVFATASGVLLLMASLLSVWLGGCAEKFDREREQLRLYELRYLQSRDAYDRFKNLADTHGWKVWAWDSRRTVGVLDLARRTYQPVYCAPPGYVLTGASRRRAQLIALVESAAQGPGRGNPGTGEGSRVVIVGPQRSITKVGFPATFHLPSIALGARAVLVADYDEAYLYEETTGALNAVFRTDGWVISKVGLVEGKFLAILMYRGAMQRLVVLSAREPYREVSSEQSVSNVIIAEENVIIERAGSCFLYDPVDRTTELLADGHPLVRSGADEFLFCVMHEGNPHFGRGALYRYRIGARQKELVWDRRSLGAGARQGEARYYNYHELLISPDGSFLFLTDDDVWRKVIRYREYDVYDLSGGKKVAAFLNPYEGERLLEFLGWDESHPEPAQSPGPP